MNIIYDNFRLLLKEFQMRCLIKILSCLILLTGCVNHRGWTYQASPKEYRKAEIQKTIAVLPFTDKRENVNYDRTAIGLIPLVPYGWLDFRTPETIMNQQFNPKEDFAKATAQELSSASIFKDVFFSYKEENSDYILVGELEESNIKSKIFFYGLSAPGDLLWLIGLPAGTYSNEVSITFKLMDKNYDVKFSRRYSENIKETRWIYEGTMPLISLDKPLKTILLQLKDDIKDISKNL